jgi:hypothetical protein
MAPARSTHFRPNKHEGVPVTRPLALTLVYQSCEQLPQTPQNVVIVVISLPQKELRMTTFLEAKSNLKQLLSPSALANDDVVKFDAMPSRPERPKQQSPVTTPWVSEAMPWGPKRPSWVSKRDENT